MNKARATGTGSEPSGHAMFVVWAKALPIVQAMREELRAKCNLLADVRVEWSNSRRFDNLRRFYQQPLPDPLRNDPFQVDKMSGNEFHVLYVQCDDEKVALHRSAAGEIEQSPETVVALKKKYREIAEERYGHPYLIHVAATPQEVRLQRTLLFGPTVSGSLAKGGRLRQERLKADVVGAAGWKNLEEAFGALSAAVDWCVMRGWDTLPDTVDGDDLDILVSSRRVAFAALGLSQSKGSDGQRNGYLSLRNGERIKFDVHWVGDGYFDPIWQSDVLATSQFQNGYRRPSQVHALMTAIYSEVVARPTIREKQLTRIRRLAADVSHSGWLRDDVLTQRRALLEVLRGFMLANGYVATRPLVPRHSLAADALKVLPKGGRAVSQPSSFEGIKIMAVRGARLVLPASARAFLIRHYRKRFGNGFE